MLVELLVLLNVRLLDFFLALLVREDHLLVVHLKLLFFELSDAILSHFSLDVSALLFARNSMLLHGSTKEKGDQVKNAYLREDSLAHEFLHI